MRLKKARIKGFGPFADVTLDLESLPPEAELVAICGENGQGKSTLVDLMVDGACWREWPRRPGTKIDHVATGRDSLLEVELEVAGRPYRVKHLVDGVSGKGESAAFCDGEPTTKSGKLTEFYGWAKEHLPPKTVVHSSIVSHPAYGSFVAMKATERKDVILLALGVEGIEKLAAEARKRAALVEDEARRTRNEIAKEDAAADVEGAKEHLAHCEAQAELTGADLAAAQRTLDVARQLAGDSALARARYEEQRAAREALEVRHWNATQELVAARTKLRMADLELAEESLGTATTEAKLAKATLADAESTAESLRVRREESERRTQERRRIAADLTRATAARDDAAQRIANNRSVLDQADQIRAAVRERDETDWDAMTREALEWKGKADAALLEIASLKREAQTLVGQRTDLEARIAKLDASLAHEREIREAVEKLPGQRDAVEHARGSVRDVERELALLRNHQIHGSEERIGLLRDGLRAIVAGARINGTEIESPGEEARETLRHDDTLEEREASLPRRIEAAETALTEAKEAVQRAEEKLRQTEARAALAARLDEDRAARYDAAIRVAEIDARDAELGARIEELTIEADGHKAKSRAATDRRAALEARLQTLVSLLSLERPLQTAEARLAELEPIHVASVADVARLTEELEAIPEPETVPCPPDVDSARRTADRAAAVAAQAAQTLAAVRATREQLEPVVARLTAAARDLTAELEATPVPTPPEAAPELGALERAVETAKAAVAAASQGVGKAQAALETAQAARQRAEQLRASLAHLTAELADWTRLGNDLGRKGLQAALVDSAGPELTRATNDLLHTCFGTRWTVTFETQKVKDDGGTAEGYDIRIIDTERGRDGVVEDLSDGERTIIGEAVSLALTELACKRAGFERPTLIRDESGNALSAERRPMWVAMLRRAARHVHADRVLLISHSEDVQELCDARVRVDGGRVEVQ